MGRLSCPFSIELQSLYLENRIFPTEQQCCANQQRCRCRHRCQHYGRTGVGFGFEKLLCWLHFSASEGCGNFTGVGQHCQIFPHFRLILPSLYRIFCDLIIDDQNVV